MSYLTLAEFRSRTVMPPEFVDALELAQPGWIAAQLEQASRWLDSRLGKRYRVPFVGPVYPESLKRWVSQIVTKTAWIRRGVDPTDVQFQAVDESARTAADEVKEAADAQIGLFDLPATDASGASAIVYGSPRVYAEASPYVAGDVQRDAGRYEDRNRRGT